jgi:pimeloyl-ACP methyl ester carboxylesterase
MSTARRFSSLDGTVLGAEVTGNGPPLLLVHGAAGDRTRWSPVLPRLAERFTVYALDRRGRGLSGDAPGTYAFEREIEDVAAVIDGIGERIGVLGHSYGALLALEAARVSGGIGRLVLYEPPVPAAGVAVAPLDVLERVEALVASGERDAAVAVFMEHVAGVPAHQLAALRALPAWQGRVAVAHTLAREAQAANAYVFDTAAFGAVRVRTLLLKGSASPPSLSGGVEPVARALPGSAVAILEGQGHVAMDTSPTLFSEEVLRFCTT